MKKPTGILIIILILAAFLRFFWLDRIPNAISGDELTYIFTAKSVALTGWDITHTWQPLSVAAFRYPPGETQAELPYALVYPFVALFPPSLFAVRFPYALLSVGIVFLLYGIAKRLFDTSCGLVAAFIGAINPWLLYMGRTSYESVPSTFFYLLSLFLLSTEGSAVLWSIPALFLAFYSYIATKLIFIPLTFIFLCYLYFTKKNKQFRRNYLIIAGAVVIMVIFFIIQLRTQGGSRVGEIFLPTNQLVASGVDKLRMTTIINPFLDIFDNKYTYYFRIMATKTLQAISAPYLFLEGDLFFSIFRHGFFYLMDIFFIIAGFYFLFRKRKREAVLLAACIFTSLLPQIFHKGPENFSIHMTLFFPFVILVIAFGIVRMLKEIKRTLWRRIAWGAILCLYIISTMQFLYIYFFQHSLQGYFDFHVRVLSTYINLTEKKGTPVIVFTGTPPDVFKKYIFYTDKFNQTSFNQIQDAFINNTYTLDRVRFFSCEADINFPVNDTYTIIIDTKCKSEFDKGSHKSISRLFDAGSRYKIFHDHLCGEYSLHSYPQGITIDDFLIESLSEQKFCETYISNL